MPSLLLILLSLKLRNAKLWFTLCRKVTSLYEIWRIGWIHSQKAVFSDTPGFIINLGHITDFDHTLIHLTNQLTAYLTRRKYRTFKDAYLLYLESMR